MVEPITRFVSSKRETRKMLTKLKRVGITGLSIQAHKFKFGDVYKPKKIVQYRVVRKGKNRETFISKSSKFYIP